MKAPKTQARVVTKTARKKPEPKAVAGEVMPKKTASVKTTQNKKVKQPNEKKAVRTRKVTVTKRRTFSYSWDVVSAQNEYILDHKQSYASIAAKYGVSKKTVEEFASANGWVQLRQELVDNGMKAFEDKHREIIMETNDRHLKLYKNMIAAGNNSMSRIVKEAGTKVPDVKALRLAAMTLKDGIEGERTVLGLPTMIMKSDRPSDSDAGVLNLTDFIEQAEQLEERTYDHEQ